MPDASVVVVTHNALPWIERCLESVRGEEVIVVDNGSSDGSAEALSQRTDIALIENDENLGFAMAVNQAYRQSRGELVLLLNSDVELMQGSVGTLVRFLRATPTAAGAAPLFVDPDGTPQPFHFRFPTFATTLANSSSLFRRLLPGSERRLRAYRMLDEDFSEPRPVPQPSASCLLLRRTSLPREQIFDEQFPIFFNDVQLARSLATRGHLLWVTPEAVVAHEAHASTSRLGATGRRQYLGSQIRMLEDAESPLKVSLFKAVLWLQNLALLGLHRPGALSLSEMRRALAGDPGPLPTRPS
jgi:GT2 family glycosyltransferase